MTPKVFVACSSDRTGGSADLSERVTPPRPAPFDSGATEYHHILRDRRLETSAIRPTIERSVGEGLGRRCCRRPKPWMNLEVELRDVRLVEHVGCAEQDGVVGADGELSELARGERLSGRARDRLRGELDRG